MHGHLLLSDSIVLSIYFGSNLEIAVIHFNHMLYEQGFSLLLNSIKAFY